MLNTNKNIHCIPSTPCIECKCDPCVCYLSICDYYSALENETLYFEHLFQYYNNRVIISSENKPLNCIKGSDMHLHSIRVMNILFLRPMAILVGVSGD
jgi:hypothetical protein